MIRNCLITILLAVLIMASSACKDKKKITDNPDPKNDVVKVDENVVKAKSTLQAIIDDGTSKTLAEKEKIVADIKAMNLNDPEVEELIKKVEAQIAKEKEEIKAAEEQAKKDALPENMLRRYFDGIANAKTPVEANSMIQQAISMFASEKATVLIIISKGDNFNDYDKPTNIRDYLNYLKDTRKNLNDVEKIHWDANQKIKTLELIKK